MPTITPIIKETINIAYNLAQEEFPSKKNIKEKSAENKNEKIKPNKNIVTENIFSPANNSRGPTIKAISSRGYLNFSIKLFTISFKGFAQKY